MRGPILLFSVLSLALAGCVVPEGLEDGAPGEGVSSVSTPTPQVFEWSGHVVDSRLEGPTHFQPTEQVLFPVFQEGFLFDVQELPEAFEVSLEWTGGGSFMIMLHSHKAHGTNAYVEHVTPMDDENPKCLRVPAADLATGKWQVMVHSESAQSADFTLRVAMLGGAGAVVEDEYHGHWLQDGGFEVEEHEPEPCALAP